MSNSNRSSKWLANLGMGCLALLTACGGDGSTSDSGMVSLDMTDAPAETITTLNPSPQIDPLPYQGGQMATMPTPR